MRLIYSLQNSQKMSLSEVEAAESNSKLRVAVPVPKRKVVAAGKRVVDDKDDDGGDSERSAKMTRWGCAPRFVVDWGLVCAREEPRGGEEGTPKGRKGIGRDEPNGTRKQSVGTRGTSQAAANAPNGRLRGRGPIVSGRASPLRTGRGTGAVDGVVARLGRRGRCAANAVRGCAWLYVSGRHADISRPA